MVKTPLGKLSLEEQRTLIGEEQVAPRESRKTGKRNVAVGASVAVLAAGAIGAYVAMSDSKSVATVETQTLRANAFVMPTEDDEDDQGIGESLVIPPFSDFDLNGDGAISNDEYTAHLAVLRDHAISMVHASLLPSDLKEEYTSRLHSNFAKEAGCASGLANKDRKRNGLVTEERYDLFYSMIKEFCYVEDPKIPPEFQPTETPQPSPTDEVTETPEPSPTEPETYPPVPTTETLPPAPTEPETYPPVPTTETLPPAPTEPETYPPVPTTETLPPAPTEPETYPPVPTTETLPPAPTEPETYPPVPTTETLPPAPTEPETYPPVPTTETLPPAPTEPETYPPVPTTETLPPAPTEPETYPPVPTTETLPPAPTEPETYPPVPTTETLPPAPTEPETYPPVPTTETLPPAPTEPETYPPVPTTETLPPAPTEPETYPPVPTTETLPPAPTEPETYPPVPTTETLPPAPTEPETYPPVPTTETLPPAPTEPETYPPVPTTETLPPAPSPTSDEPSITPTDIPTPTPPNVIEVVIPEGKAIKCNAAEPEVYRYASGERRWYPNPPIASSWDKEWTSFIVVDCSGIPRGPDMQLNIANVLPGRSVKCSGDDPATYRFVDGMLRLYPNDLIARQYDQQWNRPVVVDCSGVPKGPDMGYRPLPPFFWHEGKAIKCDASEAEVYRLSGGQRRWYPTPEIAESWDKSWQNFTVVDCTEVPRGPDMTLNKPILPEEGQAVKCHPLDPAIYRFTEGHIRWYPNPPIASSWDDNWARPIIIDCSRIPRGPDMSLKLPSPEGLPEGQAIKCHPHQPEVYRLVDGQRRWYPNPVIADSWDKEWPKFVVVDCSSLPRGDDMAYNQPDIPEGQAIKCHPLDPAIYRFTEGHIRWYPNPPIASSWDDNWSRPIIIDCSHIPRGPNMSVKLPSPAGLPEGQAIKCDPNQGEVYRLVDGQRRWYPNPVIADSWDKEWSKFVVVDCSSLPRGDDMAFNQPILTEGQAIKCHPLDPAIYRFTEGHIRWYPNPPIAASWDDNWARPIIIDCSRIPRGPDMNLKLPSPAGLPEGQAIKCHPHQPEVYRLTGGERRWYPNPPIADSWDKEWSKFVVVDCSSLPRGPDMPFYTVPPENLVDGQAVKCDHNQPEVYRFTSGQRRWYPNPVIADSWDKTWANFVLVDCSLVPRGDDMAYNQPDIPEGQAIKCHPLDPAIYRFTEGHIRWYPNPPIASSWDDNWSRPIIIDCSHIPRGPDMNLKLPSPEGLPEGQAIKCHPHQPEVYRLTGGERRWYPNPPIADSWDKEWPKFVVVDCSSLPRGPDMPFNQPIISEGQAIKCHPLDPAIYRFTEGHIRWYPNPPIASSWDDNWSRPIIIDCSHIPRGPDMNLKLPSPEGLPEGQAIKCHPHQPEVYRLTGGERRWYPNPPIADSWDKEWPKFVVVDCSSLPRGPDMPFNQPIISEGQAIKCHPLDPAIYRFTEGHIRWYPNPPIASSWDDNWSRPIIIDCSHIPRGPNMSVKLPSPAGLPEGQAIKCDPNQGEVYRLVDGQRRWYPNPVIADSWDKEWSKFVVVDCSSLPRGDDMAFNQPILTEGQAIKCHPLDPAIYRFTEGHIRWYPNPPIAASWDDNWARPIIIDCSRIPRGPNMSAKLPSPEGLPEGKAIKCDPNQPEVYRLVAGQRRWYPNPAIANSWDKEWPKFAVVDCSTLPRGDDMDFKLDGWSTLDGALVQVSFDGKTLCGVNSADDIWCATQNIRGEGPTRWRQVPGKLTHVQVYGDSLWGVNRHNQIWYGSAVGEPRWVAIGGQLKMISSDNKQLCGVNANDEIWCADDNIRTTPNWRQIPGRLSYVEVVNGRLVGTNSNGEIFSGRSHGDPKWVQLGGSLRQLSFDGANLCGVNSADDVWCADSGLLSGPNWSLVRGKMRHVVVNAGSVYAVEGKGEIFYRSL